MDPDGDYESRHSTRSAAGGVNLAGDDNDVESPSKIFLPNEDTKLPAKPTKGGDAYKGATAPPMEGPPLVANAATTAAAARSSIEPHGAAYDDMMTGKMDLAAPNEAPISNSVAVPIGFDSDDMTLPEAKALPIISSTANEGTKMPMVTLEEVEEEEHTPVPVLSSQAEPFDDGYDRTPNPCPSQVQQIDNCTTLEPNDSNGARKSHDNKSFCKKSVSVLALPYDIITWVITGKRSTTCTDNEGTTMPAAEVLSEDTEARVDEEVPIPVPVPSPQEDDSSSSDRTDTAAEQEDKSTSTTRRCTRKREWRCCCCAIAFLAVAGTVLGVFFGTSQGQLLLQGYRSCNLDGHVGAAIGNGHCDSKLNNDECGWDGGDCLVDGYPNCHVEHPEWIGDGSCAGGSYNAAECGWDGGDCVELNELHEKYPNCDVEFPKKIVPSLIGNGVCNANYAIVECGWDGGDCLVDGYSDCHVDNPNKIGNLACDGGDYNTAECGWDGGDCLVDGYSHCHVDNPNKIGNLACNDREYNTAECGWDGGDCLVDGYPDCHVDNPNKIGNLACDGGDYNTAECGWDGGDCFLENYPNCKTDRWVPNLEWIADGFCNGERYNTAQCGWDGGDCLFDRYYGKKCAGPIYASWTGKTHVWCQEKCLEEDNKCKAYDFDSSTNRCRIFSSNSLTSAESDSLCFKKIENKLKYPDCHVPGSLSWIGDGTCNGGYYNSQKCGWDGGDCIVEAYSDCHYVLPQRVGDGNCDGGRYNTKECGWDGGDCLLDAYPNCHVEDPSKIGDGNCDGGEYNTGVCGWDGRDCYIPRWPDCHINNPNIITNGICNSITNTDECGYDGGDCLFERFNKKACSGSVRASYSHKNHQWCQYTCMDEGNGCKAFEFNRNTNKCRIFSSFSSTSDKSNSDCFKKK